MLHYYHIKYITTLDDIGASLCEDISRGKQYRKKEKNAFYHGF
jgi:hypothetical protein